MNRPQCVVHDGEELERKVEIGESEGRENRETATFGVSQIFSGNLNNLREIAIFTINPDFSWKWGFKGKMGLIRE